MLLQGGSVPKCAATPPAPPPKGTPPQVTPHLNGAGPWRRSRVMCPRTPPTSSLSSITILFRLVMLTSQMRKWFRARYIQIVKAMTIKLTEQVRGDCLPRCLLGGHLSWRSARPNEGSVHKAGRPMTPSDQASLSHDPEHPLQQLPWQPRFWSYDLNTTYHLLLRHAHGKKINVSGMVMCVNIGCCNLASLVCTPLPSLHLSCGNRQNAHTHM